MDTFIQMENDIQRNIRKWIAGDETKYRKVFDYYYDRLFYTCCQAIRSKEDSEELVLNVFLRIWQHRAALVEVVDFENYLFKSLRNQIADFHRKTIAATQPIESLSVDLSSEYTHTELSFKELLASYQAALEKLPDHQREIFLLSREEGLTQKQIAEQRGMAPSTVNNQITATLKILRKEMGDYATFLPLLLATTHLLEYYFPNYC